jgi:eukaryotic-like serine/threonine-protein kinase
VTPERWWEVAEIIGHAAGLAGADRERLLKEQPADLREDVERFLRNTGSARDFIETPLVQPREPLGAGARIGPYVLTEELGRGGMGVVFRGERSEGDLGRAAAIKILGFAALTASSTQRIQSEAAILAQLQHPNIATLYDAGFTGDGFAYLVMEFIDGEPLVRYCDSHRLALQLFLPICSAVHYAHQHLIVHRDLKPNNILVTTEGSPKLLDFGIAKVLDADPHSSPTLSVLDALTPDYASPEQIDRGAATTGSDVYSLGLILYELLGGQRAFRSDVSTLSELLEARRKQPERPSKLRPGLPEELDSLVFRAMAFDPAERYASARELGADIENYLAGLPVSARPASMLYRARKFVRRHLPATATAAAAFTLIVGLAITAEVQGARAEARFEQVRALARSVIFEIYDRIAPLNGSTEARKLLASRAVEYLDSLARQSGSDPTLLLELASSYRKIATVLGDHTQSNLGDVPGAMRNIDAAIAVARRAAAARPRDLDAPRELLRALTVKSHLLLALSRRAELTGVAAEKAAIVRQIMASPGANAEDQIAYARQLYDEASDIPNPAGRIGPFQDLVKRYEALSASLPNDPQQRRNVALMEKYLGSSLSLSGRAEESLDHKLRALEIDSGLVESYPDNRQYLIDLRNDLRNLCASLMKLRRFEEALSFILRAESLSRKLMAADPNDLSGTLALASDRAVSCETLLRLGRPVEARASCEDALRLTKSFPSSNANSSYIRGLTFAVLAEIAESQKRPAEMCGWYQRAAAVFPDKAPSNNDFVKDFADWKRAAAECSPH